MKISNAVRWGRVIAISALFFSAWAVAGDDANMTETLDAWEKAYNAGDLEAVRALYAEDGCRMPPNAETAQGGAAILAQLQESSQFAPQVELGLTTSETSGDRGYATGTYAIMNAEGERIDHGKWMNVTHNVDGTWVIHCDIWNSSAPLPGSG